AVLFEDRYYEVVAAREVGAWVCYYLDPWADRMTLRRIVERSPAAGARENRERAAESRRRMSASSLTILMPLVGFLPAEVQERIERIHGIPASRSTAWSAALALAVASAHFVLALAASIGRAMARRALPPPGAATWRPLSCWGRSCGSAARSAPERGWARCRSSWDTRSGS